MRIKLLVAVLAVLLGLGSPALAALTVTPSFPGGNTLTENSQATVSVSVTNTGNAESNIVVSLASSPSWFSMASDCSIISSIQKDQSAASSCIITPTGTGSGFSLSATARSDGGTEGSGQVNGITVNSDTSTLSAQMSGDSSVSKSSVFYIGVTVTAPSTKDSANVITTISQSSGSCTIDTSYVSASQNIGNITKSTSRSPTSWKITAPSSAGTCAFSVSVSSDNAGSAAPTKSVTITGSGSSSDSSTSSSSSSSSSGSSSGSAGAAAAANKSSEKKSDSAADKTPPPGLANNTKLLAAIEKVLAKGNLGQSAIDNLMLLSELIKSDVATDRLFSAEGGKSTITEKIKYSGTKKIKNFMVHEKVPKEFAAKAGDIIVSTSGKVEIVETDPEFLITFAEALPNQEFAITYTVNAVVDKSVLESASSQAYAESLEDTATWNEPIKIIQQNYVIVSIVAILLIIAAGVFVVKREKIKHGFRKSR